MSQEMEAIAAQVIELKERITALERKAEKGLVGARGPIGPTGPIGEPGKEGPQGQQGTPGRDGKDGKDGVTPHENDLAALILQILQEYRVLDADMSPTVWNRKAVEAAVAKHLNSVTKESVS